MRRAVQFPVPLSKGSEKQNERERQRRSVVLSILALELRSFAYRGLEAGMMVRKELEIIKPLTRRVPNRPSSKPQMRPLYKRKPLVGHAA